MELLRRVEVLSKHEYWGNTKDENKTRVPCSLKGPQKSKTQVVVAVGGIVPEAVGNTRGPRIVVPAPPPEDAFWT